LFGVVREALLIVNQEGRVLKANSKAGEIFRPSGGDIAGLHFSSFFSAVSAADLAVFIQDAFASRGMEARSLRLEPEDGENLLVDINAATVKSDEHGPLLIISFRDVTRYKALEEKLDKYPEDLNKNVEERTSELEEAKERYRSLFEKAAVPLAWLDTDGVLQSANNPFYALTGLDKSVEGALHLVEIIEDESYASRIARYIELLCHSLRTLDRPDTDLHYRHHRKEKG
jgi:PAS domain S-box-containing protein